MANPQTPHESRQVRRAKAQKKSKEFSRLRQTPRYVSAPDQHDPLKINTVQSNADLPRAPIYGCNSFLLGTRVY